MENYLDFKNGKDYSKLDIPARIINQGGIVIFPTETVYGIGVNGLDEIAIKKLYEVKQRPLSNPISLLVSNINMINKIAQDISDLERKLIEAFFPGPFTIVLKKKTIVPDILTSNEPYVGVRMPDNDVARKLVEYSEVPIATSSANIAGMPSGTNIQDIQKDFDGKVDFFIDSGESKIGIASTVVKVIDGVPNILRQGSITKEQIENVIKSK